MKYVSMLIALLALAACDGAAHSTLRIEDAWSRATPPGTHVGVTYLTIVASGTPDRLLSASTPVAGHVEFHAMEHTGEMMGMRQLDVVELPAGVPVKFEPSGTHLMLIDLEQPLLAGGKFPLTLTFEHAGTRTIDVPIHSPGE